MTAEAIGNFEALTIPVRRVITHKTNEHYLYVKAVLLLLFAWGAERGYLAGNPASGIKDFRRKKGSPDANRPWSDSERDAVLDAAPAHMRLAIALMMGYYANNGFLFRAYDQRIDVGKKRPFPDVLATEAKSR